MPTKIDVEKLALQAAQRIHGYVRETPLEPSQFLSQLGDANVYLKLENWQYTGSFKLRGAMNKLLSLTADERMRGCVTASTGNHGAAVAYGLQQTSGIDGIIFVPENASPTKIAAIERLGAEVRYHGLDGVETEIFARKYADERSMTYISPYNDPQVIGGQGTIGVELAQQLNQVDVVFVALGGGGLISGIGGYLKSINPAITVIGCSPLNSPAMTKSVAANEILDIASEPTLSDGTAGGLEREAITFELCQALVDDYVLVSEDEIRDAMRSFIDAHHILIEGAAGVAIAGYLQRVDDLTGLNTVIVICGANISLDALRSIL